jgi:hypothetical protein
MERGTDFIYRLVQTNRNSVVGIATAYGLDRRGIGVRIPVGSKTFSTSSRPALRPIQPPSQWAPGVKWQGCEAEHSPSTSAEVKKILICISTRRSR